MLSDDSATQWLRKQIKVRSDSRKQRVHSFIQKELTYILPKKEQHLEQLLGDFSKYPLTSTKAKSLHFSSKSELNSKDLAQNAEFFVPPQEVLLNLQKNTEYLINYRKNLNKIKEFLIEKLAKSFERRAWRQEIAVSQLSLTNSREIADSRDEKIQEFHERVRL